MNCICISWILQFDSSSFYSRLRHIIVLTVIRNMHQSTLQRLCRDREWQCLFVSGLFQCPNKLFVTDQVAGLQIKEFARKNAANALSVANMVMGMASILSSLNGWVKKKKKKRGYWTVHCRGFVMLSCSSAKKGAAFWCCWLLLQFAIVDCKLLSSDISDKILKEQTKKRSYMLLNVFTVYIFVSSCLVLSHFTLFVTAQSAIPEKKRKEINSVQLNDRVRESKESHSVLGVTA